MSVLGEVLFGLEVMSLAQLLLAFVACAAYQLAQGSLLGRRGRTMAWLVAVAASVGFVSLASEWMHAAMLIAFGVATMGIFTFAVWATCRLVGVGRVTGVDVIVMADSTVPPPNPSASGSATRAPAGHRPIPSA